MKACNEKITIQYRGKFINDVKEYLPSRSKKYGIIISGQRHCEVGYALVITVVGEESANELSILLTI
jgi:hypothetical protein